MLDPGRPTDSVPPRRRVTGRARPWIRVAAGAVALLLLLLSPVSDTILWLRDYLLHDNLHEVVPGRLFRSAQMSQERLLQVAHEHGIKTVIDLRMGGPTAQAGQPIDPEGLRAQGIAYVHVRLNSKRVPSPDRLHELLEAYTEADLPVLVHCSSGANRTGVASAIWLLEMEGRPLEEAKDQLSMRFGYTVLEYYLVLIRSGIRPLADILRQFEATGGGMSFGSWVEARRAQAEQPGPTSRTRQ